MLIKYVGSRPDVKISCSGRRDVYFGKENNHTADVIDEKMAAEILGSQLHSFKVVIPVHVEAKPAPVKTVIEVVKKKKEKK